MNTAKLPIYELSENRPLFDLNKKGENDREPARGSSKSHQYRKSDLDNRTKNKPSTSMPSQFIDFFNEILKQV